MMAIGLIGWSVAWEPWQLFVAAIPSAAGWATTSGAALNAIVARWFDRDRPQAMSLAFNGASVGGALFIPLWVVLIHRLGFQVAALSVAAVTVGVLALLSGRYFGPSPASLGLAPDGDRVSAAIAKPTPPRLSRAEIIRMPRFLTLSGAFALGLVGSPHLREAGLRMKTRQGSEERSRVTNLSGELTGLCVWLLDSYRLTAT
jgi:MFS family permease